jgi:Uma2 family endonuclease
MATEMVLKSEAAPSPTETTVMTGEELFALGDIGRAELVKGELVRMAPTGHAHGYIEFNFGGILYAFVRGQKLGRVLGGEVGIYTQRDPDTVRGADVAFISNERLAQVQSQSYLDVAPELIIEIMSPEDRWSDVMEKLEEYFAIGVQVIWVADPRRQQVYVYRSLTQVERLTVEDVLSGGDLLPGFQVSVAELFGVAGEAQTVNES